MEYPKECQGCKVLGSGIECGDCGFYPQRKAFFDSIPNPICTMMFFFEGDEDCNESKCDYEYETRRCSISCTTPEIRKRLTDMLEKQEEADRI